jgi:hypothetical protein
MPYGGLDLSRIENIAGMDEVTSNSRNRATLNPTVVQGSTIPINPLGSLVLQPSGQAPISTVPGAASTITFPQLQTGFVVQAPSAGNTSTLDTAANMVGGFNAVTAGAQIGDIIPCYLGNGSASNTITVAAGSGGSFDANQPAAARVIPVNSSRYIFIRLTNVTAGAEAYVIYL